MHIVEHLRQRWLQRRDELQKLRAAVDGAVICDEILADLSRLEEEAAQDLLSLTEAAKVSGYSPDHLGRLVKKGTLENHGRKNAPLIRRDQLPIKPGHLPPAPDDANVEHPSHRRVALAVLGRGSPDGTEA